MTSEGHEDQHASSAPDQPPSMFRYRPPPDPPAPYGYPPATDPAADPAPPQPRTDTVQPAPDRVRGTASVPLGRPPAPEEMDRAPTRPSPGSLFDPATPAAPGGEPGPPARGTAAVVPVPTANRATPAAGEVPQIVTQPRVYQTAAGVPQPVSPPATAADSPPPLPVRTTAASAGLAESPAPSRSRQSGLPVYSDLLGPATTAAPPPPPPVPPRQAAAPAGYVPPQRLPAEPFPTPPPAAASGEPSAPASPAPTGGAGPERSGPPVSVIVGLVLIGATVLVLGALSVPFLLDRLNSSGGSVSYSVGDCVVQDGTTPRSAGCTDPGAFEIVAQVDSREECTDPTQPAIEVPGPPVQFYCLAPVAAEPAE